MVFMLLKPCDAQVTEHQIIYVSNALLHMFQCFSVGTCLASNLGTSVPTSPSLSCCSAFIFVTIRQSPRQALLLVSLRDALEMLLREDFAHTSISVTPPQPPK